MKSFTAFTFINIWHFFKWLHLIVLSVDWYFTVLMVGFLIIFFLIFFLQFIKLHVRNLCFWHCFCTMLKKLVCRINKFSSDINFLPSFLIPNVLLKCYQVINTYIHTQAFFIFYFFCYLPSFLNVVLLTYSLSDIFLVKNGPTQGDALSP